jgi:hypothetical protein
MKIRPVEVERERERERERQRQRQRQTDMTKLVIAFRNFANAPKNTKILSSRQWTIKAVYILYISLKKNQ